MSVLGERIKLRRAELGISQDDLAETLGTNRTQISRYETGYNDPTGQVIVRLAEALMVSPSWLLGFTEVIYSTELSDIERELLRLFSRKDPEIQQKFLEFLKIM